MKIALTGGIACGKSEASKIMRDLGVKIISLDAIAKDVVEPNTPGLKQLVDTFGKQILDGENLNRNKLRELLLANKENQTTIENILHPKILEKMQMELKQAKNPLKVVEVPLLAEKNLGYLFDRAIVVSCDEEKQLKRLKNRPNINEKQAKQLINAQFSHNERLKALESMPVDIIENNSEIIEMKQKVKDLYQKLINL